MSSPARAPQPAASTAAAPGALPEVELAAARARVAAGEAPDAVALAWLAARGAASAAAVGPLYESLLSAAHRRGLGAFYTPPGLAAWMVAAALPDPPAAGPLPRVVDPACGGGVFLLAAARRLEARARAGGHAHPRRAAAAALFGVDRDPGALAVCRAILAAEGYPVPAGHLVAGDALLGPWPVDAADAVVGNPPFVNIVRLPGAERGALKARYRTFRNKCDLYGLFVEAAADHLAPGGRVALVLSDSFLGTSSFAPLRRLLFAGDADAGGDGFRAVALHRVTGRAFGAAVHPVVVVAGRGAAGPVRLGSLDAEGRPGPHAEVDPTVLARRAARSAVLPTDPARLARLERMAAAGVPLGTLCTQSLGVKTADDARFVAEKRGRVHRAPCVRGRTVSRYRVQPAGWLDYRPEVLRTVHGARPRKRESFERPLKVLLRETAGGRLIAAMDTAGHIPLDTVHVLHEAEGPGGPACSPWYLLAVLNAAPTSAWYGLHHPGSHVKLGEVRALPVPAPFPVTPDPGALADAVSAAACFLAEAGRADREGRGDPGAPIPAACLAPSARHGLLDVLARWRTAHPGEGPRAAAWERLVDAVVAAGYGLEGRAP